MILYTAIQLGIFDYLHKRPDFSEECARIASDLKVDRDGLRRLLDSLVAIGILTKPQKDKGYTLTEIAINHLVSFFFWFSNLNQVSGLPGYIGDLQLRLANDRLWNAMRNLPQTIQNGQIQRPKNLPPTQMELQDLEHSFGAYQHTANALFNALSAWLSKKKSLDVLDFGCRNGVVGFSFAVKMQAAKVVCNLKSLDAAAYIPTVAHFAEHFGIPLNYVDQNVYNFTHNPPPALGGPYDLIIVGKNMLDSMRDEEEISNFLECISQSLKSTGRVVFWETVRDAPSDNSSAKNPYAHLASIAMFAAHESGKVHSYSWFCSVLENEDFKSPTVVDLNPFPEKLLITFRSIISRNIKRKQVN